MQDARRLPICFGRYDRGNRACDGDHVVEPCHFRDRCVAFGMHTKKLKVEREELLILKPRIRLIGHSVLKSHETDVELDRLIIEHRIRDGRAHSKNAPEEVRTDAEKLVALFLKQLEAATKRVIEGNPSKAEAGDLFAVQRLHCVSVHGRPTDFTKVHVCTIFPRSNSGTLTIRVAAPFEPIRGALKVDLHQVRIEFRKCKKQEFFRVARFIASAIKRGDIDMGET